MDISKIKIGKSLAYRTSRGTTGRGKVDSIDDTNRGVWVTLMDKTRNKVVKLRPAQLSA